MLGLIPREILLAIVDHIPDNRDRNSLSQVCKKLYALLLPTLYDTITVRSRDESNLTRTDIDKFLRTANRDYFTCVKNIRFLAPIETNDQFRCIHYQLLKEADEDAAYEELMSRINNLGDLMPQIRPLFQGLQDSQLRSFHWHLGTCVPTDLLGPGGYLPTRQRSIEELSLNTGDPCILPKSDLEYHISLAEFKSLKKFSWSGGLSREFFDALRDLFRTQSTKLEVLKIDLMDWWDAQWNWCDTDYDLQLWIRDHNFFREKVLELAPGDTRVLFPSLKSLLLSSVQFEHSSLEMAYAFNISRLQSLNLRHCPHTGSFLRKVVESSQPINLRSLELVIEHTSDKESDKEEDEDWIIPFLDSFEGLTSLHLLVINERAVNTTDRYWPSIFHHKKTLKRLVYHEQWYNEYARLDCNKTMDNEKIQDLFTQMNLECLGMCLSPMTPDDQLSIFSHLTLAQRSTLKFLYVRTTGYGWELEHPYYAGGIDENTLRYAFVRWALSTFPRLLFIAFGDFSYGTQFTSTHEILHRHPFPGVGSSDDFPKLQPSGFGDSSGVYGFRLLEEGDHRFECHLDQFRDVLEACPSEPLYRKDF